MKARHLSWAAIPILNVLQQFLLKEGADQAMTSEGAVWILRLLGSPWFMAAIGAEIACFVIWMTVLAELDLGKAFPLSAISYVLIMALAWLLFSEPASVLEIIGSLLILAGVWCIASAGLSSERQRETVTE